MPKRDVETELERLNALRHGAMTADAERELKKALRDPVNAVVQRAAQVAAALNLRDLVPELTNAFKRLFEDPVKRDPQCLGKTALAKALKDLEHTESETYLLGVRFVQKEPVWGGEKDSAAELRGTCLLALVQCVDIPVQEILLRLIDGLADPATSVREDAVHSLLQLGNAESALLLRLKARLGDEDPALTGAVLEAVLKLEEERAFDFVSEFLAHRDEEIAEQAAVALGASRLPAAIELLKSLFERERDRGRWERIVYGIGVSRLENALGFLCELVRNGRPREGLAALKALETHRQNPEIVEALAKALVARKDAELQTYFDRHFPTG